jgi:hypothetical protein
MKRLGWTMQALLLGLLFLGGCSGGSDELVDDTTGATTSNTASSGTDTSSNLTGINTSLDFTVSMDSSDDTNYTSITETVPTSSTDDSYDDFVENSSFGSTLTITYSGSSATVSGSVDGVTVTIDGANVSVASTATGVNYVLKGSTTSGTFKVASSTKKYEVTLDGVSITNPTGPAINLQSSKRSFMVATAGTTNSFADGKTYTTVANEDMKGCIFTEGQIIFSGTGAINVTGNYKHAICSDDYIRLRNGSNITVTAAAKDGIHANDAFIDGGGTLTITSAGDGIEVEEGGVTINSGLITINSVGDAIKTSYDGTDTTITPNIAINGGLLKLTTTGEKGQGVKSVGTLALTGGIIQATVSGAASKGLSSDGYMTISGGKLTAITSGAPIYEDNDLSGAAGIKCDGTLAISGGTVQCKSTGSGGKGISGDGIINISGGTVKIITTGTKYTYNSSTDTSAKGIKADGNLTISGGAVMVRCEGGDGDGGSEGIESKKILTISGGETAVQAPDDAVNAATSIVVSGGYLYAYSSGNDGIDSNGSISISGGVVIGSGTTSPEEGLDCDNNTINITGGVVIGTGGASSTMGGTQYSVGYGGTGTSGNLINIQSKDGTSLLTYKLPRTYSSMTLQFSSPSLKSGTTYSIYSGGSMTGGTNFYGYCAGATYTKGTSLTTFTPSSVYTTINVTSGMGGGGTPGGGGFGR